MISCQSRRDGTRDPSKLQKKPMQLNQLRGHFDASSLNGANVVI
jgi:hypothetical protein